MSLLLSLRCLGRFRMVSTVLLGVLVLTGIPLNAKADLTPAQQKDIVEKGIKAGEQDQQIKEIEEQINKGTGDSEKLKSDKDRYQERIDAKRGEVETLYGREGRDLFDKAREYQNKQDKLKELEKQEAAETDQKKKERLQRKIKGFTFSLENDYSDVTKHIETADSPKGKKKTKTSKRKASKKKVAKKKAVKKKRQEGYTGKGTARLSNGQKMAKSFLTANQTELTTLVSGFDMGLDYKPMNFKWSLENLGGDATGDWKPGDEQFPPVQQLDGEDFSITIPYSYASSGSYKLAITHGYDSSYIFRNLDDSGLKTSEGTINLNFGIMNINNFDSHIIEYKGDTNPWKLSNTFGINVTWNVETYPNGVFSDLQVDPDEKELVFQAFGTLILGEEHNAGITGVPAPGLIPSTWPKTWAQAIPHSFLKGSR